MEKFYFVVIETSHVSEENFAFMLWIKLLVLDALSLIKPNEKMHNIFQYSGFHDKILQTIEGYRII